MICWYRGPTDFGRLEPGLIPLSPTPVVPLVKSQSILPEISHLAGRQRAQLLAMISLLLLDLDGVVVYEVAPPRVEKLELILLHDLLVNTLQAVGVPVVVLTHRSRAEATVILGSAGLEKDVAGIMAAEDILNAAFSAWDPVATAAEGAA